MTDEDVPPFTRDKYGERTPESLHSPNGKFVEERLRVLRSILNSKMVLFHFDNCWNGDTLQQIWWEICDLLLFHSNHLHFLLCPYLETTVRFYLGFPISKREKGTSCILASRSSCHSVGFNFTTTSDEQFDSLRDGTEDNWKWTLVGQDEYWWPSANQKPPFKRLKKVANWDGSPPRSLIDGGRGKAFGLTVNITFTGPTSSSYLIFWGSRPFS